MAEFPRPRTRRQKRILLAILSGAYTLLMVLVMIAVGGVGWSIRLPALAAAIALAIAIGVLLRKELGPGCSAAPRQPERLTLRQQWPTLVIVLSPLLLGGLWEGSYPLLVLGGVLIALLNLAVMWRAGRPRLDR